MLTGPDFAARLTTLLDLWMQVSLSDRILAGVLVVAIVGLVLCLMWMDPRERD